MLPSGDFVVWNINRVAVGVEKWKSGLLVILIVLVMLSFLYLFYCKVHVLPC